MSHFQFFKTAICLLLSFSFFNLSLAKANATFQPLQQKGIVGTMEMMEASERESSEKEIQNLLDKDEVKNLLMKNGLDKNEVSQRVASLSDSELLALKGEIQEAKAGGILGTILIVILIIYFAQRI